MAYSEDYRELVIDARNAIEQLLDDSTHDSWGTVRGAYGVLRVALERDDAERERNERAVERRRENARLASRSRNGHVRDLPVARPRQRAAADVGCVRTAGCLSFVAPCLVEPPPMRRL
jgi:hypothetical protein